MGLGPANNPQRGKMIELVKAWRAEAAEGGLGGEEAEVFIHCADQLEELL